MPPRPALLDALLRWPARLAALPILVYRYALSPMLGPRCRFHPTCSAYGLQALERFGLLRGGWLILVRLARCHPWHPGGVEPLPDTFEPPARYLGRVLRDAARRPDPAPPCGCDAPRPARDDVRTASPSRS